MWETRIRMHSVGCPFDCLWSLQKIFAACSVVKFHIGTGRILEKLRENIWKGNPLGEDSALCSTSAANVGTKCKSSVHDICGYCILHRNKWEKSGKIWGLILGQIKSRRAFCPLWQEKPTWNWNSVVQAHKHHYFDQIMAWHLCVTCSCDALCFAPGL